MFNPAWSPTQAELVDMRFKQAQTDKIYAVDITDGKRTAISIDELRASRFQGGYGFETVVGVKKVTTEPLAGAV